MDLSKFEISKTTENQIAQFDDMELAIYIAKQAGELLKYIQTNSGLKDKELGDYGDKTANDFILKIIRKYRPRDGILSEEEKDDLNRLKYKKVWIIDPLDGTREYREGLEEWAVHIGIAIDNVATIGAVAIPARNEVFSSQGGQLKPLSQQNLRLLISRSREPKLADELAQFLDAEIVHTGSAGAKAMAVVRGEAEIYYHNGGQYEWDNCAPVAVAQSYGLHCSRIDGSEFKYNQKDVFVPDLLICRKEYADKILEFLKSKSA